METHGAERIPSHSPGHGGDKKTNEVNQRREPGAIDHSRSPSSLCDRCTEIEEYSALQHLLSHTDTGLCIGPLDAATMSWCALCRLFTSVLWTREKEPGAPLAVCHLFPFTITASKTWGARGTAIFVLTGTSNDSISSIVEQDHDQILSSKGALSIVASDNWSTNPGALSSITALDIQPHSVNFAQLRSWIDSCEDSHSRCSMFAHNTHRPRELKLIDCEKREIIRDKSYKYVALSYVWGLPSLGHEEDPRSKPKNSQLPDALLPTIEDAITATRHLGYRYLWIDRYCIDQECEAEKNLQIAQMNLIYRHAEVSIIAAAGDSPHFGLPGVGKRSRISQPSALINGLKFVPIKPSHHETIKKSKWYTRGWTYQEGYFSRRRLFFFEDRAFFSCQVGCASEDICHLKPEPNPQRSTYADENLGEIEETAIEVLGHLALYSGKQLTYQSDAIRAIAGVFNDHALRDRGPVAHYLGIPMVIFSFWSGRKTDQKITRRPTDAFLIGLGWMNQKPGKRWHLWPSWTWAEWDVTFEYDAENLHSDEAESGEYFAQQINYAMPPDVSIERQNKPPLSLSQSDATWKVDNDRSLTNFLRIKSWVCELNIHVMGSEERMRFEGNVSGSIENCRNPPERFYGTFKDPNATGIKVYLWPLYTDSGERSQYQSQAPLFAPSVNAGRDGSHGVVVAVALSRQWLDRTWALNMMLLQHNEYHYERVGHCSIFSPQLRGFGIHRGLVTEAEWPDRNHHPVKMGPITKVLDELMDWKTVRVG